MVFYLNAHDIKFKFKRISLPIFVHRNITIRSGMVILANKTLRLQHYIYISYHIILYAQVSFKNVVILRRIDSMRDIVLCFLKKNLVLIKKHREVAKYYGVYIYRWISCDVI